MNMYGEFDGPNWRDDPLENTPPVRRSLNVLRDEMRAVACGNATAAPVPQVGDQCADTDGLAAERDPLLASLRRAIPHLEAFRAGFAFPSATAGALPRRALNPVPRTGGLFCLPL